MNKLFSLKAALVAASILVLPLAQAATMTRADYNAGKNRIGADYKADKVACAGQAGNAKDICVEEAKAREKVARAAKVRAVSAVRVTPETAKANHRQGPEPRRTPGRPPHDGRRGPQTSVPMVNGIRTDMVNEWLI